MNPLARQRLRYSQAESDCFGILPFVHVVSLRVVGPDDWRATRRLDRYKSWSLFHPSDLFQKREHLPHPNQSHSASKRVNDPVRGPPAELFTNLQGHRCFAVMAVGRYKSRGIVTPFTLDNGLCASPCIFNLTLTKENPSHHFPGKLLL